VSPIQLHCHLGHPSLGVLRKLCPSLASLSSLPCESCQFVKYHRIVYLPCLNKKVQAPFEIVHSDIWGPCPMLSKSSFKYFVTFADDYSRVTWLFFNEIQI